MGLFDFYSQKWKRELLHHQGWDTVTWVQQLVQEEDEEKEMSQTGCWKGVSTSLGSKFLPAQAEVSSPAAMQHQRVLQPSCAAPGGSAVPALGTSSVREAEPATAHVCRVALVVCWRLCCLHRASDSACLELKYCSSQSPISLKAAVFILITLSY